MTESERQPESAHDAFSMIATDALIPPDIRHLFETAKADCIKATEARIERIRSVQPEAPIDFLRQCEITIKAWAIRKENELAYERYLAMLERAAGADSRGPLSFRDFCARKVLARFSAIENRRLAPGVKVRLEKRTKSNKIEEIETMIVTIGRDCTLHLKGERGAYEPFLLEIAK